MHFSPSTRDFAFASKVRLQRFISDSGTRTALLTVLTTRDAALPSELPASACTTGRESGGVMEDAMDSQLVGYVRGIVLMVLCESISSIVFYARDVPLALVAM